jgi:hypothetical protein
LIANSVMSRLTVIAMGLLVLWLGSRVLADAEQAFDIHWCA